MRHGRFRNMPPRREKPRWSYIEGKAFRGRYSSRRNADDETLALSTDRKFLKIIKVQSSP